MKRVFYASRDYTPEIQDEFFVGIKSMKALFLYQSLHFPRNVESNYHKPIYSIPTTITPITFAEATDRRTQEIIAYAKTNDLPIVIMWSGGIDSTVMLAAVIKHFPPDLLERVVVRMNNASYAENPHFFNKFVRNILQYTSEELYDYTNSIIIYGDPADSHWSNVWLVAKTLQDPSFYTRSPWDNEVRKEITRLNINVDWFLPFIINNARKSNIEIARAGDFYWWLNFNFSYSQLCLKHFGESNQPLTPDNFDLFLRNGICWYTGDDYQMWSITSQFDDTKFMGHVEDYKMQAKQYIFEVDKNPYYRDNKSKIASGYLTVTQNRKLIAIFEDKTVLLNA